VQRILNGTGVLLHTNLGRARMDEVSARRAAEVAGECFDLEFDLETGARGDRYRNLRPRLQKLVGAADAIVVNNNAAAVLLCVHALAQGKDVVVSRAELVEIGGSFRIPEIVRIAGGKLRLVGAVNSVGIQEYRQALEASPGLVLKVHQSNFRVEGPGQRVETAELAALCHEFSVALVEDVGSGTLVDLQSFGLPYEPTVQATLKAGANLVTFSGDKLLGGPQCGCVVGDADLIARLKQDHLLRTVRVGKVTDALLCECLDRYIQEQQRDIPFFRMLSVSVDQLEDRALRVIEQLRLESIELEVVESEAQVGAGACPEDTIESRAIALSHGKLSSDTLKARLLALSVPIVGRIKDNRLLIDFRSLLEDDLTLLGQMLEELDGSLHRDD